MMWPVSFETINLFLVGECSHILGCGAHRLEEVIIMEI